MSLTSYEIHPSSLIDPNVKKLLQSLKDWLNGDGSLGIFVKDLFKDLTVAKLLASNVNVKMGEEIINLKSFQSNSAKDFKLIISILVGFTEKKLFSNSQRWSINGILSNDFSSLLCFLTDLAVFCNCPFVIPSNVTLVVTNTQIVNGATIKKNVKHTITISASTEALNVGTEATEDIQDVYEQLIYSPEKVEEVSELLITFVNTYMEEIGVQGIQNLQELHDGSRLLLIIGMIGGFFIPLKQFHLNPSSEEEKKVNLDLAGKQLSGFGMDREQFNQELFLQKDEKTIIRCLISLQEIREKIQ